MLRILLTVILFIVYWPLKIAAAVLYAVALIVTMPLRIIGMIVGLVLRLFKAVIYLPAAVTKP